MPDPPVNPRKPSLSEDDRATIEAALVKLRADGGNLFLEAHLEAALEGDSWERQEERIARTAAVHKAGYEAGKREAREFPNLKGAPDAD